MNEYVLTIDAGTTSIRCILFDRMDDIVSMSQRPITQYYPEPGWVEQDPMELIDLGLFRNACPLPIQRIVCP